jgi:sugar-specific transcriptional regulator TrmB
MDLTDKARKAMEALGLTSYEIKVYGSLIEFGAMTASDLSAKSLVPYSKIYEVLKSLEQKGWIESNSSRPQKFFPRSPRSALESTRLNLEDKLKLNETLITDELMPIYEKTGVKERPEIWVVRGLNNIVFKANEMIQSCNKELLIALPEIADDMSKLLLPPLRTISEKGIKITVLASAATNKSTLRGLSRISNVKVKDDMFGGGVIADGYHVMILLADAKSSEKPLEPIAIWSVHPGLAQFSKEYFQYLWQDARFPSFEN